MQDVLVYFQSNTYDLHISMQKSCLSMHLHRYVQLLGKMIKCFNEGAIFDVITGLDLKPIRYVKKMKRFKKL